MGDFTAFVSERSSSRMATDRSSHARKLLLDFSGAWRRVPLNAPSVKLLVLAGLLSSSLRPAALAVRVVGTTNTQAVLSYTAPDANACVIKVSENSSLSPLVHDVDPTLFPGTNLDSRTGTVISGTSRIVVAGKRVTEKGADGRFYSRALQTYTTHYYQLTCGSSVATGTFQTANIALGNTYADVPQVDSATGQAIVPTFPDDRTTPVIDPQTGALVKRLWLPQDTSFHAIPYLNSGGQTRMCGYHLVGPGPGYLCYFPAYDGVVYYIIPTTGEVRFLGELWISGGSDFPGGGTTGVSLPSLAVDANDSRILYAAIPDTAGQGIIVKGTYTGDYSAKPGAARASFTWENFTPGPQYYPGKLIKAFDPTFDPAKFFCSVNAGGLNPSNGHSYALLQCNRATQNSYGWVAAMDMGNGLPMDRCGSAPAQCPHIVGAINLVKNPQSRWCGVHNAKIIPDTPVINLDFHGLTGTGVGAGPYQVKLTRSIGPGDTTISVSGEPLSPDPVEPYLMDAAVGDVFILQGPTPEYISIVAKNSSTSWVVKRAFVAPQLWTAQSWPAGTTLSADCENQVNQIPGLAGSWLEAYWKFLEDPRGTTGGYLLDRYFAGNHGDYQTNLRVAGGFQGVQGPLLSTINTPLTFSISPHPTFAGVRAFADGNSYSDYPSYQQANAPPQEQNWFLATREFLGGGNAFSADQGAQLISGQLYKYAFATWWGTNGLHRKQMATIAASGGYNLTDISGPGRILSDTPADSYKYCAAQVAGECHGGSQPGDVYVNAPNVRNLTCTGGNGSPNPGNLDLCVADMSPDGHSAYQYGLVPNSEGVTGGTWGAGYSRRITSGFSGIKGEAPLFKPLPDGTWAFFDIYGFMLSSDPAVAPGLVMVKMPPFVKSDAVNRTTFLSTPLTVTPPTGQGIVSVGVEFGYGEQGLPGQYFCTSRREACLATTSSVQESNPFNYEQTDTYTRMPCGTSCTIALPVLPGHVAYYQVKYYSAAGAVVALGDKGVTAETATSGTGGTPTTPPITLPPAPPNPPANPKFGNPTTSSLVLSWTAAAGPAAAGYRLDVATDALFTALMTGYQNKDIGNVTTTLVAGLSAGTTYFARLRSYDGSAKVSTNSASVQGTTAAGSAVTSLIRVNCGGPAYTDASGQVWSADTGFTGGSAFGSNSSVSGPEQPPTVYQSVRWGNFLYQFTVPNGLYNVKLKFAELFLTTAGTRITRITINGSVVDPAFDIIAAAGGPNIEVNRVYPITVTGGQITIQLGNVKYGPILNGIEILASGTVPSPAVISGTQSSGVASSSAVISWTTDIPSDSQVDYGITTAYGLSTPLNPTPVTSHQVNLAGLTAGSLYHYRVKSRGAGTALATSGDFTLTTLSSAPAGAGSAGTSLIRVNCGGPAYTDASGQVWKADTGFTGGSVLGSNSSVSGPEQPPTVYQSVRWGNFLYQFTVANGLYNVKLKFAELFLTTAGTRITRITINGTVVDPAFDIIAAAGGPNIEVNRVYPITVTGGQITIQLGNVKYGPILNGIEILQ